MSEQSTSWDTVAFTQGVFDLVNIVENIEKCKSACKLVSVNVKNLPLHASDIVSDCVFMMADFQAFSETRKQADSQVTGFVCVSEAKRSNINAAGVSIFQSCRAAITAIPH